jgi:hypothetical protein
MASGIEVPFLYSDGKMLDLNTLIAAGSDWTITNASDINDNGQIVADGFNPVLQITRALLLNPTTTPIPPSVPVPAALWLFGSALAGWVLLGRRQ